MDDRRPSMDIRQYWKDKYFTRNRYRLDSRFVIRDGKRRPFAVICPGGAYREVCSYIEGVPIARELNELGCSAFILYYRVREKARFPAPQEDLARAVRDILSRADSLGLDAGSYSVWGASAGGHLAASFGTASMGYQKFDLPKPAAIVLTYPVISMARPLTHPESRDNLLGPEAGMELEAMTSIERHVTGDYPPTYLWCGDSDTSVSPENTRRMAAALAAAGVPHRCEIFPGVGHGVGLGRGTAAAPWFGHAAAFWREHALWPLEADSRLSHAE